MLIHEKPMSTTSAGSVSGLIEAVKSPGGSFTADQSLKALWDRFSGPLVALVGNGPEGRAGRLDEESVVLSAFRMFHNDAKAGKYEWLGDRDALWRLLVRLTKQKAWKRRRAACMRHETLETDLGQGARSGPEDQDLTVSLVSEQGHEVDPGDEVLARDLFQTLRDALGRLKDPTLLFVAEKRLERYTNREIAEQLDLSERAIELKMMIIRDTWFFCFGAEGDAQPES
jgi:DNA-directed RNA polymerase specialized sigma24 family protein